MKKTSLDNIYFDQLSRFPRVDVKRERQLGLQVQAGDVAAITRLAEANLRLVVAVARKYVGRGVPLDELIQLGNVGLLSAARKFDAGRGIRFSTYAHFAIKRQILRGIRHANVIRVPDTTATALAEGRRYLRPISLDEPIPGMHKPRPFSDLLAAPASESELDFCWPEIARFIAKLPPRERKVISQRFGLEGPARTLDKIGRDFGLSKERIRQIERNVLQQLRTLLKAKEAA